jgi:acyl carrier protein
MNDRRDGENALVSNKISQEEALHSPQSVPGNGDSPTAVSATQAAVTQVWSEVLQVARIEATDNFFDLGGDSLKAMEVISRLQALLNIELPLIAFFEDPTIAHLASVAEELRSQNQTVTQPSGTAAAPGTAPLSFAQLMFWLLQQTDPLGHLHNQPRVLRIHGDLRADILQRALDEICIRHDVLRAHFEPGPEEPVQVIDPRGRVKLQIEDLSSIAEDSREEAALAIAGREWQQPFNLAIDSPLRARLVRLNSDDHFLIIITHHLITDGHTPPIFFHELSTIYNALLAGTTNPLAELTLQYPDYATWERLQMSGERLDKEIEYWRSRLAGAPPMLDLPTDKRRPERSNHTGEWCGVVVPLATLERLKALASATGATLFTVMLSALRILLHRWTSQEDIVIGTVAVNRTRAGSDRLIGCFLNFLPLRNSVSPHESAANVLKREKQIVMEAFAHQDCPFPKIVAAAGSSRITDANPIYNVALLLQTFPEIKFTGDSLTAEVVDLKTDTAQLDLRFVAVERAAGLQLDCEFVRSRISSISDGRVRRSSGDPGRAYGAPGFRFCNSTVDGPAGGGCPASRTKTLYRDCFYLHRRAAGSAFGLLDEGT